MIRSTLFLACVLVALASGLTRGQAADGPDAVFETRAPLSMAELAKASTAGVSAGIDMALALAARIAGPDVAQAIQLGIEYDPQPPFDAGSPLKAPESSVNYLRNSSRFILTGRK